MDQISLRAELRSTAGTRPTRRQRREGLVPAVVYGKGMDTVSVTVSDRDLFSVLHTEAGLNALIDLEVDGGNVLTVAREIQRHPVRGDITHLDFIKVSLDEPILAEVGIELLGTPVGVHEEGGIVESIATTVTVRALPTEIPPSVELEIAELSIGDTLTIGDLPVIPGVEYVDEEERPLVTILAPRKIEEEEVPEEELEGVELEEGEEAPAAEAAAEEPEAGDEE
jgi:large subunit ribosomal protein L25